MDTDAVVSADLHGGWQLVEALARHGCEPDAAFWAMPSDEARWLLFLSSSKFDALGPYGTAYRLIHDILRDAPEWGVDPFKVMVLESGNPMAAAAAAVVGPKPSTGPLAVSNPKPYRGVTRYNGSRLGPIPIDGAFIYPKWEPRLNPVG
jgi:hypothetical protein